MELNGYVMYLLLNLCLGTLWGMLFILPNWSVTRKVWGSPYVFVPPLLINLICINIGYFVYFPNFLLPTESNYMGIVNWLAQPVSISGALAHTFLFDMMVARSFYLSREKWRLSPIAAGALYFLSLAVGPIAFVVYLIMRKIYGAPARAELTF